jgi:dephospho-CoA kinase
LRRLESIIHPAVRPRILALMTEAEAAGAPAVVVEAIKLVEGGLADLCDEVWLVVCDPLVQRQRVIARERALTDAAARTTAWTTDVDARIAAQGDLVTRLTSHATRVLDTSGSIAESRARVVNAWAAATRDPSTATPDP